MKSLHYVIIEYIKFKFLTLFIMKFESIQRNV